jgi:Ulp1 family protease
LNNQFRLDTNVFAFNLYDTHWIGAKLEKSKKRILVYDSYPGAHETQFKQIEEIAGKIGVQGPFQHINVTVPHQRNATDCGVTTCLFLLCMAHNIEDGFDYDSPTVMRQFRLTLFDDILNQEVTVLVKRST